MSLSHSELQRLLHYDPETGIWTRLVQTAPNARVGACPGYLEPLGYLVLSVGGKGRRAHRLAWFYMTGKWPKYQVDHKNGIKTDNRWNKLREATNAQNQANTKLNIKNTSGLKGVSWHKHSSRWRASLKHKQSAIHLGVFDCPAAAHFAYIIEADKYFGLFARVR